MKRRAFLKGLGIMGLASTHPTLFHVPSSQLIHRIIPSTQEKNPVIGMGSWLTFDVKGNAQRMANMQNVLATFYPEGGRVLDSSPMYGSSEEVIGTLGRKLGIMDKLWISTKVWTTGKSNGLSQIQQSNRFLSHPVQVNHVLENMEAGRGYVPTPTERKKMYQHFQSISQYTTP